MPDAPPRDPPPPHQPARIHRDALLARACDDLRTPLTAALGHTQLLRRRLRHGAPAAADHARLDHGLAAVEQALARMAAVLDRLDPPPPGPAA